MQKCLIVSDNEVTFKGLSEADLKKMAETSPDSALITAPFGATARQVTTFASMYADKIRKTVSEYDMSHTRRVFINVQKHENAIKTVLGCIHNTTGDVIELEDVEPTQEGALLFRKVLVDKFTQLSSDVTMLEIYADAKSPYYQPLKQIVQFDCKVSNIALFAVTTGGLASTLIHNPERVLVDWRYLSPQSLGLEPDVSRDKSSYVKFSKAVAKDIRDAVFINFEEVKKELDKPQVIITHINEDEQEVTTYLEPTKEPENMPEEEATVIVKQVSIDYEAQAKRLQAELNDSKRANESLENTLRELKLAHQQEIDTLTSSLNLQQGTESLADRKVNDIEIDRLTEQLIRLTSVETKYKELVIAHEDLEAEYENFHKLYAENQTRLIVLEQELSEVTIDRDELKEQVIALNNQLLQDSNLSGVYTQLNIIQDMIAKLSANTSRVNVTTIASPDAIGSLPDDIGDINKEVADILTNQTEDIHKDTPEYCKEIGESEQQPTPFVEKESEPTENIHKEQDTFFVEETASKPPHLEELDSEADNSSDTFTDDTLPSGIEQGSFHDFDTEIDLPDIEEIEEIEESKSDDSQEVIETTPKETVEEASAFTSFFEGNGTLDDYLKAKTQH